MSFSPPSFVSVSPPPSTRLHPPFCSVPPVHPSCVTTPLLVFQVLLGEVNTGLSTTQVVVKELKASASVREQMHFLEEAQPYRCAFTSLFLRPSLLPFSVFFLFLSNTLFSFFLSLESQKVNRKSSMDLTLSK